MNWLDIVLLVGIAFTLLAGLRAGFFRTVLGIIGLLLGLYLAPRISAMFAGRFAPVLGSVAIASVVVYVIVIFAIGAVAAIAGNLLHRLAGAHFLGWADHLMGAAVGLLQGLLVGLAIIAILAILAFRIGGNPAPAIQRALTGSALVPHYLNARSAVPGRAQAFIPGEFARAFDELERRRSAR